MGIKIVRTPSETPNITNVDDIIPFRYAYGNQNGYVIGRGSELSGSYESGEFTVGSGRAVIQGVEVDIDANGVSATLDTANETRYFKIYLKVNLVNEVTELESYYSTVSYDEIEDPTSSELINDGTAYLLLYQLKLNGTTQVELVKSVKQIEYSVGGGSSILWSGDVLVNTTGMVNIGNVNIKNKTVEIAVEDSDNKVRYFKFKTKDGGMYMNCIIGAPNQDHPEVMFFRTFYSSSTNLQVQIFKVTYTLGSSSFRTSVYTSHVLSIREIKE